MDIEVTCPSCEERFYVELQGRSVVVDCPFCGAELEVEGPRSGPSRHLIARTGRLAPQHPRTELRIQRHSIPQTEPVKSTVSPFELILWLLLIGAGLGAGWWWWTRRTTQPEQAVAASPPAKPVGAPKLVVVTATPPVSIPVPAPQQTVSQPPNPAPPPLVVSAKPPEEPTPMPPQPPPMPPVAEPAMSVLPPPAQEAGMVAMQAEQMKPEEEPAAESAQPKKKEETEVKLTSPGFETLEDWNIERTAGLVRLMTAAAHSGNRGLRITDSSRAAGTVVSYKFPTEPGDLYRCSFWARVVSGSVASVSLRFVNPKGEISGNTVVIPATCKNWTEFTVTATAPEQTKEGQIWIATPEGETVVVDFDDFRLLRTR
ncbi:MAG: hypothetical protein N3B01_08560 [Verrucomicrobiae bacterium]|nr:hypothetical protein [Verrucomicrobiae bacterium]